MLLNTVIIALSDALPIFILLVINLVYAERYLTTQLAQRFTFTYLWFVSMSALLGIIAGGVYVYFSVDLSELFDNTGLELSAIVLRLLIYSCGIAALSVRPIHGNGALYALVLLNLSWIFAIALNGSNFFIYMVGYWSQVDALQSLVIGAVLGLGVCISFSILFYFLLRHVTRKSTPIILIMLCLHLSGQALPAMNLLVQIDIFNATEIMWDWSQFIEEDSEVGRLFKALIGYEARPSQMEVVCYLLFSLTPVMMLWRKTMDPRPEVLQ